MIRYFIILFYYFFPPCLVAHYQCVCCLRNQSIISSHSNLTSNQFLNKFPSYTQHSYYHYSTASAHSPPEHGSHSCSPMRTCRLSSQPYQNSAGDLRQPRPRRENSSVQPRTLHVFPRPLGSGVSRPVKPSSEET